MAKGKTSMASVVGFWLFIAGLVIAVVFGFLAALGIGTSVMPIIIIILVLIGIAIGFLNITAKEILLFLVATIALIVVGNVFEPLKTFSIGAFSIGTILDSMLALVATLMAPAAVVAAIKALWAVGRPGD